MWPGGEIAFDTVIEHVSARETTKPGTGCSGMNGSAEAVRQLRETAVNQVLGAARTLVTAGAGVPVSGLVLTGDG